MSQHAYSHLPDHCFWRETVGGRALGDVDPVIAAKFKIGGNDRVVTAGSCFAQHVSRHLAASGFHYFVTEAAHPLFDEHLSKDYNYGVFSTRSGSVYTVRQLAQWLRRAYGLFSPEEDLWPAEGGRAIDPFRPAIQPKGFACAQELRADRAQHLAAVRRAVEQMDVLVFTLGLTEAWVSARDGAVFPLCPGVAGGVFDPDRHRFHNFNVREVTDDLAWAIEFIATKNPRAKIVLTVSPVPLAATAEDRSVIVSTTYSKSVLRVAAEEVSRSLAHVAYFPSYEIVAGTQTRGEYFAANGRDVTAAGVSRVMELFMRHYAADGYETRQAADDQAAAKAETRRAAAAMEADARTVCEEEMLAIR